MPQLRALCLSTVVILLLATISGCRKGDTIGPGGGGGTVPDELKIEFVWNDDTLVFDIAEEHYTLTTGASPWTYFSVFEQEQGSIQVALGYIEDEEPTAAQFTALFAPGTRNYIDEPGAGPEMGVSIIFFDPNGVTWTTFGPQPGSSFVITGMESTTGGETDQVRITGNFSAIFYDMLTGEPPVSVTNGTYTLTFNKQ